MDKQELSNSLEQLRAEITTLGEDDEPAKIRMNRLVTELERQLDDSDDAEHPSQLLDSLRHHIEYFEVEHPRLTGVLNRVMVTLSNLGI